MNPQQPQQPFFGPPPQPAPIPPPQLPPVDPNDPNHPLQQYDFIMDPSKMPKKPKVALPGGGSKVKRIAFVAAGGVILLIIIIVVSSLLGSKPSVTAPIVTVAQEQTELSRVATAGITNATSQTTQNLAVTIQLAMTTANQQTIGYLSTNGVKLTKNILGAKHSQVTDVNLANALANSTYDSEFTTVMQSDLNVYSQALSSAYKVTTGPKGRLLLETEYDQCQLLITASNAPID